MTGRGRVYEGDATQIDRAVDLAIRRREANQKVSVIVSNGFGGGAGDPGSNGGGLPSPAGLEIVSITVAPAATETINFGEYTRVFFCLGQQVDDAGNDQAEAGYGTIFRNIAGAVMLGRTTHEISGAGTGTPNADWLVSLSGSDELELDITNNETADLLVTLTILGRH